MGREVNIQRKGCNLETAEVLDLLLGLGSQHALSSILSCLASKASRRASRATDSRNSDWVRSSSSSHCSFSGVLKQPYPPSSWSFSSKPYACARCLIASLENAPWGESRHYKQFQNFMTIVLSCCLLSRSTVASFVGLLLTA